jgi:hypothetical protein
MAASGGAGLTWQKQGDNEAAMLRQDKLESCHLAARIDMLAEYLSFQMCYLTSQNARITGAITD